jgi:hypothetical protein
MISIIARGDLAHRSQKMNQPSSVSLIKFRIMKNRIGVLFTLLAVLCGCSEDDISKKDSVIDTVKSGTWRITYYWDSDHDETSTFNGYSFTFAASDALSATNGVNTYPGTWSVTDSNSNDDSLDDLHFNIFFASPADFADLTDDWEIIGQTSVKIRLQDVSGGGGGTDYLTFEKN